jgi:hypothetical protein
VPSLADAQCIEVADRPRIVAGLDRRETLARLDPGIVEAVLALDCARHALHLVRSHVSVFPELGCGDPDPSVFRTRLGLLVTLSVGILCIPLSGYAEDEQLSRRHALIKHAGRRDLFGTLY